MALEENSHTEEKLVPSKSGHLEWSFVKKEFSYVRHSKAGDSLNTPQEITCDRTVV